MRHFFIWLAYVSPVIALAQETDSIKTSYLKEVSVYGMPVAKYSYGSKVESLNKSGTTSLSNELTQLSSIYLKDYGNGQLSTIAFRGTSASQTSVLWNGVNIGSQTLGQTDFSLLPSYLLDDISIQYGPTSSLYGSDGIGGSVLLNQRHPDFKKGLALQYQQQAGSFGQSFEGLKSQWSSDRWEIRTKVMNRDLKNNFGYNSPAVQHWKKQNNAAVNTHGFNQQIHYKISDTKRISFEVFYVYNHRQIQPNVLNDNAHETLLDKNSRVNLSYYGDHNLGAVYASVNYIRNNQLYDRKSKTLINQTIAIINVDKQLSSSSSLRYGLSSSYFLAQSSGFSPSKQESRNDLFASYNQRILPFWNISLNARQSFYAGHHAPFSPSLGSQLKVFDNKTHLITIQTQLSRAYRVPTLNDRYYKPGGNPDILPEDARHLEGGFTWTSTKSKHIFKTELTAYKTLITQCILWQPDENDVWSPTNLQKVNTYGAESSVLYKYTGDRNSFQVSANYSYTRSKNLTISSSNYKTIGAQLPYIPFHKAVFICQYQYRHWQSDFNFNYTGYRYTTLNNDVHEFLKSNYLMNLSVGRKIDLGKVFLSLFTEVNNILNLYYENYENYAMPGRNYNLTLTINYKTN